MMVIGGNVEDDTYWSNIFKKEEKEEKSIYTVLSKIPIFRGLSRRELKAIERILHRRTYKADEAIFYEEEPGVGMYIITSGKVYITLGKEKKVLAVLTNGDFFGEMALLLESPRTASATAHESTELLGFFQPDLFNLLQTKPKTGNKILQHLAQMIAERLRQSSIENQYLKNKLNEMESKTKKSAGTH